jgi:hypothetical protein
VTFLKSKSMVESTGCTILSSQTSASGYSEGGVAAFVGALALEGLGLEILNVDTGGAPFRPSYQYAYAIDQMDKGTAPFVLKTLFAMGTTFFSSKIPDLPNTNMGQNILNDQWLDLMVGLADTSTSMEVLNTTLPDPVTDIVTTSFPETSKGTYEHVCIVSLCRRFPRKPNQTYLRFFLSRTASSPLFLGYTWVRTYNHLMVHQSLIAQNIFDVCFNSTVGVDDLLCQAIEENSYVDLIEATEFPVTICHSPNDELVPIANAPNVSTNPLLSKMTLLGQEVLGTHYECMIFCYMTQIIQFSSFGSVSIPLTGIEPLSDPSKCNANAQPASAPTNAAMPSAPSAATPTAKPTPSSNAAAVGSAGGGDSTQPSDHSMVSSPCGCMDICVHLLAYYLPR